MVEQFFIYIAVIFGPLVFLAIFLFPRIALLGYLSYFYVMYLIAYFSGDFEFLYSGGIYIGVAGGMSQNFVVMLLFLLTSLFYIGKSVLERKERIRNFFSNPGSFIFIAVYLIALCAVVIQSTMVSEPAIFFVLKKMVSFLIYPALLVIMWVFFNRSGDDFLALRFSLVWLLILVSAGVLFAEQGESFTRSAPLALSSGMFGIDRRIGGIFFGPNNTAAFLAMYFPFLYYSSRWTKGFNRLFWLAMTILAFFLILLTLTRVAIIALVVAFIVWLFLERRWSKKIAILLFIVIGFTFFFSFLSDVLLRGGEVGGLTDPGSDTLGGRIYNIWLPAIEYMFEDNLFWYGTPERSFGDFMEIIRGRPVAAHSATLTYFVSFGLIVAIMWLCFWAKIIRTGLKTVKLFRMESRHRDLICASTLSLIIFFICAHTASVMTVYHMNPVIIVIFMLWKARENILKEKNAI